MRMIANGHRYDCCPLCTSSLIAAVGKLGYSSPVLFSTASIQLQYAPELWRCGCCESAFTQFIISTQDAAELYLTSDSGNRWSRQPFCESKTPEVVSLMRRLLKPQMTVLDVGCNTGELLDFAGELGCTTIGVELSSASLAVLKGKGHKTHTHLSEVTENSVDIICAFDLIEHLHAVPSFLAECRAKLKKGGCLVILTGDVNCVSARLSGPRWWYASFPEHIVFPSDTYFKKYSGYSVLKELKTYASAAYREKSGIDFLVAIKAIFKRVYRGLPSLGSDHRLYVLEK